MELGDAEYGCMPTTTQLHRFRELLYTLLTNRADATLDLRDTLCTDHRARNVAELSLSPACRRGHDSVYAVVDGFHLSSQAWATLRALVLAAWPSVEDVWVLSMDTTPHLRPCARTLVPHRSFIL